MLTTETQAFSPAFTLKTSVRYLKGVGPEKEKLLARLGVKTLGDLFDLLPRRHEKRFPLKRIGELAFDGKECVAGVVTGRGVARYGGRSVFKAVLRDGPHSLFAVFYHQPYLAQVFRPKLQAVLFGAAEKKGPARRVEMTHPEWELFEGPLPARTPHHGRWVPIYPLTEDLRQKSLRQTIYGALKAHSGAIAEALPASLREKRGLADSRSALRQFHFPADEASKESARRRLVYEEFLLLELFVESRRAALRRERPEIAHKAARPEIERFLGSLPFKLTAGQRGAIEDVLGDLRSPRAMNRLIQGDVGSGKTAVAAAALYFTVKNGFQGALMAPTETLAQQLYLGLTGLLEPFGIRVGYFASTHRELETGQIDVAVGTHALLEPKVRFKRLGLAIVDEQHKFGVKQRSRLARKQAGGAHFLMMTATPIPRSLAMTLYGDMDISVIAEKPKGRKPVRTLWLREEQRAAVYQWLGGVLEEGGQAYVVCPLVAPGVAEKMRDRFPEFPVGFLHGRMRTDQKQKTMQDFKEAKTRILVSTTVVEVGIDVPRARFMLVENAEKFGLAQLHQLRGRVGRGEDEAYCVLFSDSDSPQAAERLEALAATGSGFEIAEKDLEQRGAGQLHGARQHGLFELRIGDLALDAQLLKMAKEDARSLIETDPKLSSPAHRALGRKVLERYGNAGRDMR